MLRMDRLYDASFNKLRKGIYAWVHAQVRERPENTVAAAAAMFLLLCQRYKLSPRRVLDVSERVLRDASDRQPVELRAMRRLLREELPDV